jgi:HK97 family phage prohead protease
VIEYRDLMGEIRTEGDGSTIMGWACRFNEPADLGAFKETVQRNAFDRTIANQGGKIRLLAGHSASALPAGSITLLQPRDQGLWLEARVADTAFGRDVKALARDGHPIGLSIGFSVPDGGQAWSNDRTERSLTELRLHEISLVGAPAYDNADVVGVRAAEALLAATANLRVGKKLSASSADSMKSAVATLVSLLADAGISTDDLIAVGVEEVIEEAAGDLLPGGDEIDLEALASKANGVLSELLPAA